MERRMERVRTRPTRHIEEEGRRGIERGIGIVGGREKVKERKTVVQVYTCNSAERNSLPSHVQ